MTKTKAKKPKPSAPLPRYVKVHVDHDDSPEDPLNYDMSWTLEQFNNNLSRYVDPEKYRDLHRLHFAGDTRKTLEDKAKAHRAAWEAEHANDEDYDADDYEADAEYDVDEWTLAMLDKLEAGLAYWVDRFEHGNCVWSLSGQGPQCRWDNSPCAGFMYWDHKPEEIGDASLPPDARKAALEKDAECTLEVYTQWCNGDCYGYQIADAITGEDLDSCWGFFGDDIWRGVKEGLPDFACVVEVTSKVGMDDIPASAGIEEGELPPAFRDAREYKILFPGYRGTQTVKEHTADNLREAVASARRVLKLRPPKKQERHKRENPLELARTLQSLRKSAGEAMSSKLPRVVPVEP